MKAIKGLELFEGQKKSLITVATVFETLKGTLEWGKVKDGEFVDSKHYTELRKGLVTAINSIEKMRAHVSGEDSTSYTSGSLPSLQKKFHVKAVPESMVGLCAGDINGIIAVLENMGNSKNPKNIQQRTFVNADNSKVDLKKGYFTHRSKAYKSLKEVIICLQILSK